MNFEEISIRVRPDFDPVTGKQQGITLRATVALEKDADKVLGYQVRMTNDQLHASALSLFGSIWTMMGVRLREELIRQEVPGV